jgi:hypothetical protein
VTSDGSQQSGCAFTGTAASSQTGQFVSWLNRLVCTSEGSLRRRRRRFPVAQSANSRLGLRILAEFDDGVFEFAAVSIFAPRPKMTLYVTGS